MDFNNNNFFNPNMNPYFTLTSFNLDNSDPAMYNMNQQYMPNWDYPTQYVPHSQYLNKTGIIIITLHRVSGDTTLPSHIVNHLTNIQLHTFLLSNNQ